MIENYSHKQYSSTPVWNAHLNSAKILTTPHSILLEVHQMNLNCLFQGAIFTSLHCKMKQILARAWIVNFTNASFRLYIFTKQVNSAILKRLRRLSDINRYHLCNPAQTGFEKVHWGMESCIKEKKRKKKESNISYVHQIKNDK